MSDAVVKKRPVDLTILSGLCLGVIVLTILFFISLYNHKADGSILDKKWYLVMIAVQLPIIAGVIAMYLLKRIGIWLFLLGKVLFFALPFIAGVDVMGLMTPIFFIESATFFILFGKLVKNMS